MISSRLTNRGRTTIPEEVRAALNLKAGESLAFHIHGEHVILTRPESDPPILGPFANLTEWASEADHEAYDQL